MNGHPPAARLESESDKVKQAGIQRLLEKQCKRVEEKGQNSLRIALSVHNRH